MKAWLKGYASKEETTRFEDQLLDVFIFTINIVSISEYGIVRVLSEGALFTKQLNHANASELLQNTSYTPSAF